MPRRSDRVLGAGMAQPECQSTGPTASQLLRDSRRDISSPPRTASHRPAPDAGVALPGPARTHACASNDDLRHDGSADALTAGSRRCGTRTRWAVIGSAAMLYSSAARTLPVALVASALLLLTPPRAAGFVDPWNDPARVLVIYNTSWPDADGDGVGDSLEVAQYYAARRGVPAENLLGLPLTPTGVNYDASQWALFLSEMRDPLLAWLAVHGDNAVDTLLFCHGVPYQVDVPGLGARSIDSSLCVPYKITNGSTILFSGFKYNTSYFEGDPTVPPDKGHFDHALYSFQASPLYLHCRLDGISAEHSKALVDRAAYGHAHVTQSPGGYTGVAYVDSRYGIYDDAAQQLGYPFGYNSYNNGDKSMAYGKFFAAASGFEWHWEPWETEIGEPGAVFTDAISAEFAPAALFYEGWYNYGKYQHAWEWKTGAVACDLNSNSCQGIR